MTIRQLIGRYAFALAAILACGNAVAAVLALAPHGANLRVIDVASGNATVLEAPACCAVQTGTVAADAANDRVFFVANATSGPQLYTFRYGVTGSISSAAIMPELRVSHLDYDAAHARLVGFAASDDGGIEIIRIATASAALSVTGALGPDCCVLRSGISAYVAAGDLLYAIGRRSTDTSDRLLAFSASGGTLQNAYDPAGARIVQLIADGSSLYALVYDEAAVTLRAAAITFAPSFTITTIGSGASNCCFVLAGPAAIDHANGAVVTLARSSSLAAASAIESFSLTTGNPTAGSTVGVFGLFEDNVALFDRIFANGFE
jgi:YD repeat-containing protein